MTEEMACKVCGHSSDAHRYGEPVICNHCPGLVCQIPGQLIQLSPETLGAVFAEVLRAQAKHGDRTPVNPQIGWGAKLAILVEEVGEVATATSRGDAVELRAELIQVAAMAAAWIESLDRIDANRKAWEEKDGGNS